MAKPKHKKRRKLIVFAVLAVIAASLAGVAYLKRQEPPITIQKEKVTRRNLTEIVVANGKIQPVIQVKISPEVSGEIIELPVKEGQQVKKGDLLVKIKPDNYIASRNSAEANYKYSLASQNTSKANAEKADLEFKRISQLYKSQLVSDSAYLEAKTTYDVAKASLNGSGEQVEMAHASLQKAEDDLSKTTIYSPLTGTITKLNSELGERVVGTAMMAGTEIMTVSDLNEMEARVEIGEVDVVLIAVGQKAELEVDAFKNRKFNGAVSEIANSANNASSTGSSTEATKFEVKIRISEKQEFRPGMSVTAEIETRSRTNVLAVPIQSVTTRMPKDVKKPGSTNAVETASAEAGSTDESRKAKPGDKKKSGEPPKAVEVVFVVDGDHVKAAAVKRGISDDNYVEIESGLKEGEDIVTGGYKAIGKDLEDGKKVMVGPAKGAGKDMGKDVAEK